MKKFYFLGKDKLWRGPFSVFQMLQFTMSSEIMPQTAVWRKGKGDLAQKPGESIFPRRTADKYFAKWLFGSNLKIAFKNLKFVVRQKLNKGKNSIFSKPLELPSLLSEAITYSITPSLAYIHDFETGGKFEVPLIYYNKDLDEYQTSTFPAEITMSDGPGLNFSVTIDQVLPIGGVEHLESYGLHRTIFLKRDNEILEIAENSVVKFKTKYAYTPQILRGTFTDVKTINVNDEASVYYRFILDSKDSDFISPLNILSRSGDLVFDHDSLNIHESVIGARFKTGSGFTEIKINGQFYHLFSFNEVLIIDSKQKGVIGDFQKHCSIIRKALAFFSGKYYGGEVVYLISAQNDFQKIEGIWYQVESPSVISKRRIHDFRFFNDIFNANDQAYKKENEKHRKLVSRDEFSTLCSAMEAEQELLHTIDLIINAMGNPDPVQQGALYSVALETITNYLSTEKSPKPIEDKNILKEIKADLLGSLDKHEKQIDEVAYQILKSRIDNINSPTNQDKLVKTFELLSINLTEENKKTIGKRNKYLHGLSPLKREFKIELNAISMELHTLISLLILKHIKYSGFMNNLPLYAEFLDEKRFNNAIVDFSKQMETYIERAQKAVELKDKKEFEKTKEEFNEFNNKNLINNLLLIID